MPNKVHRRKYKYNGKDQVPGEYTTHCKSRAIGSNATGELKYVNCRACIEATIGEYQIHIINLKEKLVKGEVL